MATNSGGPDNICRLCGKQDSFLKDMIEQNNRSLLILIRDLLGIHISPNDILPTKICYNCEDIMLSFHLFSLECTRIQDSLKEALSSQSLDIKLETFVSENLNQHEIANHLDIQVKCEVKHESNQIPKADLVQDDDVFDDGFDDNVYHNEDEDNIALVNYASVPKKKEKKKRPKELPDLSEILKHKSVKANDLVRKTCHVCNNNKVFRSFAMLKTHCKKEHQTRPVLFCICGYRIVALSSLYKHVSDHRRGVQDITKAESSPEDEQKISQLIKFNCFICDEKCIGYYSLKDHCETVHQRTPMLKCACGSVLRSRSALYKHVAEHKNPQIYRCDKCPKVSRNFKTMAEHKYKHVPKEERVFQCDACTKTFNSKCLLKSHLKSHIPIEERKQYKCDLCQTKMTSRSSLMTHKKAVHLKVKSFICDICGHAFSTNGELKQHRVTHSEDKPYTCSKCPKKFKTPANVKAHEDTHGDTSYVCHVCSRVLNSRRTLAKHLLVHRDDCPHVCAYCHKGFKRRQTLKMHMAIHTGDKPLKCGWCSERFSYASSLRAHRLRFHPDKPLPSRDDGGYKHCQGAGPTHNIDVQIQDNYKEPGMTVYISLNECNRS